MVHSSARLCVLLLSAAALIHADSADAAFARIDAAAKTFKGVTADSSNTDHNALVNSDDTKPGTAKFLRAKSGQIKVKFDFKTELISYDGREVKRYTPKTNTVDVFNVADKKAAADQYLALGFGATSADLKASYDVSYIGEEPIGGQPASHLKLIPKSPDARRQLKQVDLWYSTNGVVVQQKILHPSGDYNLVTYSNMKFGSMSEKDLELQLPKGVIFQKH